MRSKSLVLATALAAASLTTASGSDNSTYSRGLITSGQVALGDWADAYAKAKSFVDALTTDEKYSLITGSSLTNSSSVNFTALEFKDGSEGVQQDFYVSGFSQSSALAMTWDKEAIYRQAKAIAAEYYGRGYQVINGPTSEPLGRTVWGGRLGEAFGPDPYQNGITFGLSVKAYTDTGIIAGGKHFLLNEQETNRQSSSTGGGGGTGGAPSGSSSTNSTMSGNSTESGSAPSSLGSAMSSESGSADSGSSPSASGSSPSGSATEQAAASTMSSSASSASNSSDSSSSDVAPYSSNADDKTIHEAYLWPFYDAVKAGMGAVMCAMTQVNGSASCESEDLLMGLLKTELGFPGLVYADVGGQKTADGSAVGGLDYGSSSTWSSSTLDTMISNGSLTEARLDDMAIRNVIGWYFTGQSEGVQPSTADATEYRAIGQLEHSKLIREIGAKSIVLLKNTNSALPLKSPRTMSIFGANAGPVMGGPNTAFSTEGSGPTFQGHLASGSGSGEDSLPYLITPEAAITLRASQDGTMVKWLLNDTYTASDTESQVSFGSDSTATTPGYDTYAENTEVCLCFINALAGEGSDRTELYNEDQDTMINTVASNCNNTIVVVTTTGARLLDQWIEHENITAVLYHSPIGQESGNSITDVLYGSVNPSARLTYTIAKNESDYNVDICEVKQCNFTEGVYLDYRYFDNANLSVRYPFGHGLSYTSFEYSSVSAVASSGNLTTYPTGVLSVGGKADLWDTVATVSVRVANTGSIDGAEVPQLYIGYPSIADQPIRQLRGFERVEIAANTTEKVTFELRRRDVSYWDTEAQEWALPAGEFKIYVGASSRDLRVNSTLTLL